MTPRSWPLFIPLVVFIGLIAAAMAVLSHGTSDSKFALHVDEPAPATDLPVLGAKAVRFNIADWRGRPYLVNFFASWCVPCHAEHDALLVLAHTNHIPVIGIAYKDKPQLVKGFLDKEGNPYAAVVNDDTGRTGIDWGITGVPETFLVDRKGVIRVHLVGPLTDETTENQLLPMWKQVTR